MPSLVFPNPHDLKSWWREGVLYQVYPRSFADSNGDGVGDLPGLIARLDYLEWLGVDGIWLNPTMPSPNADWGYDVSDYRSVHPELGTLDDLDRLIAEAARRGIRILLDLVPNHTSDRHPWFLDSRSSRDSAHRDWYVWADRRCRRLAAERLDERLRRACLDARPGDEPVVPAPVPGRAAGPQLVERGRPRRRSTRFSASGSTAASRGSASTSPIRSSRTPTSVPWRSSPASTTSTAAGGRLAERASTPSGSWSERPTSATWNRWSRSTATARTS